MANPWEDYEEDAPWNDPSFSDTAIGVGEAALTVGSSALAQIPAGVSGLVHGIKGGTQEAMGAESLADVPDKFSEGFGREGARVVELVEDAYGYTPKTESGKDIIQSLAEFYPIKKIGEIAQAYESKMQEMGQAADAGALRTSLAIAGPAAFLEFLGLKIPSAAAKVGSKAAKASDYKAARIKASIDADKVDDSIPTEEGIQQTAQTLQKGKPEEIALDVMPDPDFYKASEELGITAEPLASFASKNPQYRAVEQGLASMPASQLDMQSRAYIADVSKAADRLIENYGGTIDKGELSTRFLDDSMRTIDDIYDAETNFYNAIESALPGQTRVDANNIISFIDSKIAKSGGWQPFAKQNPRLAKMYRQLKPKKKTTKAGFDYGTGRQKVDVSYDKPTYEVLNDIRREIGQQLGRKGDTSFKTTETGLLKAIYGKLKEDQNSVARTLDNGEDLIKSADSMTIQRKQLEDNLTKLLGTKLQKDLMPVVGQALKGLAPATGKVNIKAFKETMESVPAKYRGEVMVSALNDVFRGQGANNQAFDATQFNKFMNQLNRSPASKTLMYSYLPKGAPEALENLHKVSKGVSDALGDKITTGRLAAFFDEQNGMLRKMLGSASQLLATKVAGPLGGIGVGELLKQSTDAAQTTSRLLASPGFQKLIKESVRDGVIDGNKISKKTEKLEKALEKSARYKKWAASLDESSAAKLSSMGIVNYLLTQDSEE